MEEIGYDTSNSMINLKTLAIVINIYIIKFLVCVIAWIAYKTTGRGLKVYQKLKYEVFFEDAIAISIEGFLELCISGYL